MSKKFSNTVGNRDITVIDDTHDHFMLRVRDHITASSISVSFDADQAPTFALAIVESVTGEWPTMTADMSNALHHLRVEVKRIEERAAAEADRVKLESEALVLFKASGAYGSDRLSLKFSDLEDHVQQCWLAVARAARELNKEAGQ